MNSCKERLLVSTLEWMKKGKAEPSVGEIASAAGLKESVIYRYYRDKQDLLFQALEAEANSLGELISENLNGIVEHLSRLSRFMWVWLDLCDKNIWFFRCLYFSCMSKPAFYRHALFRTVNQWWETVDKILEDGIQAGVLPSDLPVVVTRDMILGLLDMECLFTITKTPSSKATDRFDNCYSLVIGMLRQGNLMPRREHDKRKIILDAVEEIVAAGESDRLTTASIAKKAAVAEGTIYNYFHDKEDLILAAIERRLGLLASMADEFFKRTSPVSKLIRFIFYHFTVYMRYPFAVKTFLLKGIFSEKFYSSSVFDDYERYLSILDDIVAEGIREGVFAPEVDCMALKRMLTGFFVRTAQMWFYKEKEAEVEMMNRLHAAITLVLRALIADSREYPWLEKI
ncbi:MAG: TetR/AcrR family transcriptional regulator [Syntrophales bacterium]|nr:TetR/AcrR family transcriptional regulator [Syntrophales bacterium]